MSEWHQIETEKRDGDFKFYGLTVVHADRRKWFEAYYLYQDDDTGEMMEPSGDVFSDGATTTLRFGHSA